MKQVDFPDVPMRTGARIHVGRRTDDDGQQRVALTFESPYDVQIYGLSADEADFLLATLQTTRALLENPN